MSACTQCGACCACFRVDFAVYELDDMGGTVPAHLTMEIKGATARMRGTDSVPIRCIALGGTVGQAVDCAIYTQRPSPCREFTEGSEACARARAHHGMPPLPAQGA
ncbi:YkgJ family cysteine cluster protein [Curvibacter sp. APW13]|uniref:YkgJ family cysteine cluster protein n=1 Tax=Curvibacter sp. APW13 TaxID=3077236 RepID=UPI0028DF72D4|nr:YkgJ family cysteine cluster protein [Curvibacter sp. APW13]MDT8991052.1 YkgJ family cysteine cluster protein [Curvibacter sp. APW13]